MCISIVWCLDVVFCSERPHPADPLLGPEPVGWGRRHRREHTRRCHAYTQGTRPTPHIYTRTWGQMPVTARDGIYGSRLFPPVLYQAERECTSSHLTNVWWTIKFVWGTHFWVNGDVGDGGVFKNAWELSLEKSVLPCVTRCLFASGNQSEV